MDEQYHGYCLSCMEKTDASAGLCPFCRLPVRAENEPHQLQAGSVLNGRYLVGRVLGQGGFGITYIGLDLNLDMKVAIKEYYPSGFVNRFSTQSPEVTASGGESEALFSGGKDRFLDEARALARFSSDPNIVCVRDFFLANNTAYIVMEYLEGESLLEYLKRSGPMSFDAAFGLLEPVMTSLGGAHRANIVHRDISPSNLMLLSDGRVKLLDFGTARESNAADEKSLSIVLKPGFAPEEQYRSHGAQGPWTDVYALCATIYKLITGKTPENSMNRLFRDTLDAPSALGAKISPAQEKALLRGMAVRQEDRIQTMEELREAFSAAGSPPVPTVPDDELTVSGADAVRAEVTVGAVSAREAEAASGEADSAYPEPDLPEEPEPEPEPLDPAEQKKKEKKKLSAERRKEKRRKRGKVGRIILICLAVIIAAVVVVSSFTKDIYSNGFSTATISDTRVTAGMLRTVNRDKNITALRISGCELSDEMITNISQMKRIEEVYITDSSGFTDLTPLAGMATLDTISVTVSVTGYSIDGDRMFGAEFPNITVLDIENLELSSGASFLGHFPSLTDLKLAGCTGFDDTSFFSAMPSLKWLNVNDTDIGAPGLSALSGCTKLDTLKASCCGLDDVSWAYGLAALETLRLDGNELTDISALAGCTQLTSLNISDNSISDISPLVGAGGLVTLVMDNNQVSDLSACEYMLYLEDLQAANNQIADLSGLHNVTQLEYVGLAGNLISDISVLAGSAGHLISVKLDDNQLTDISALAGNPGLLVFSASYNQLTDLDALSDSVLLRYIAACGNEINDISVFSRFTDARCIDLGENQITDISALSACLKCDYLLLQNNRISDISGLSSDAACLAISLFNNPITDFSHLQDIHNAGASAVICVSYAEGWDYSQIALSDYIKIELVDVPLNERANIETATYDLKREAGQAFYYYAPTFMNQDEAAAQVEEVRSYAASALSYV